MLAWLKRLFAPLDYSYDRDGAFPIATHKGPAAPKDRSAGLRSALARVQGKPSKLRFPIQPPVLLKGVVPEGETPLVAMDSSLPAYDYARTYYDGITEGFPGYPYLAALATRAEYRAFASSTSTEMTREWITINSSESAGDTTKAKVTEIMQEITKLGLQKVIQTVAEHDSYFGRGQIFLDIQGHDRAVPLALSPKTVKKGAKLRFVAVEPMWTTPSAYNAIDPAAKDFYKPSKWFMLGREVHASRLLTIITRPVPDMLKPAFNFSGMSMSQLAESCVNNWLRTRQATADTVDNFSITVLKTRMDQIMSSSDDPDDPSGNGTNLMARLDLFTALRSNKGVMALDKDSEELDQVNTPLSGLSELQAQAQEHMCAVSKIPAVILTGISPTGLNASSDGEIRVFYDWIAAQQESNYREPIEVVIKLVQLSLYGDIDPDIIFTFEPLYQMTPKELSEIRLADSQASQNYISSGVIDPQEDRERLARDPESGYQGIDVEMEVVSPNAEEGDL